MCQKYYFTIFWFHLNNYISIENKHFSQALNSFTLRTLHECNSPFTLRILKIRESSMCALFQYNCTPNTTRNAYLIVSIGRFDSHARRVNSFASREISFCRVIFYDVFNLVKVLYHIKRQNVGLCRV